MKLVLDQFDSRKPFIQLLYLTPEGSEVISLNLTATSDDIEDAARSPEDFHAYVEKLLGHSSLELSPANSNGLFMLARIPYSFYKGTYASGLNVTIPEDTKEAWGIEEDAVQFSWCPSMGSYVVSNVVGPKSSEDIGRLVLPVLFKDEVEVKNISTENFRAFGLMPHNPFKDWHLSFSQASEEVEQDFGAIVTYRLDDNEKEVAEMMEVVCSDSELAQALKRNEITGEDNFQVHALFEYYELIPLSSDGDLQLFILRGAYEPKLGILERQDIAKISFTNLTYKVEELLLPTLKDKAVDMALLNESIAKAIGFGKLS